MKKFTTLLCMASLLINVAALTGCKPNEESSDSPTGSGDSSAITDSTGNSINSDKPDSPSAPESNPEPQKPAGEPTFLTAPDGTPIYTSEISEAYTLNEDEGGNKTITLEQAKQYASTGGDDFTVKCEGFAYGFIPEKALNRVDNPEMFEDRGSGSFDYLGEEFDYETFEGEYSTEYTRINVGDKFGTLTVKSAYTLFKQIRFLKEFSETPGAYLSGGAIAFDGEVELTGYVEVWEDSDYEGAGGTMIFYPDGDSSVKIPVISYNSMKDNRKFHRREADSDGYFGDWSCSLGNMSEVECDTSGLHKGDVFVKVKITANNVTSGQGGVRLNLKNIEVL